MRKCNGSCGTCPACVFRKAKGVTVCAPGDSAAEEREREARVRAAERSMERQREAAYLRSQGAYEGDE